MKLFRQIFIFFFVITFFIGNVFAEINMTVSPIKYEIEVDPGDVVERSARLYNYSGDTLNISTSKAEFQSDGTTGQPKLVNYDESGNSIASWITIHTEDFMLAPNGTQVVNFDIVIPDDATPGGHYGAVLFQNHNVANGSGTNIGINVDYGVLLLITVSGDIIVDGGIEEDDIIVKNSSGGGWGGGSSRKKDDCSLGDFSKSNFDNKCIDDILTSDDAIGASDKDSSAGIDGTEENNEDSDSSEENIEFEQLDIAFEIPFDNNGNTHIKPTGKITLKDDDGKQITQIGKQVILNDNGAIIGERIVDFIPINDIGGNVLPQTKRIFEGEWKGFPHKEIDDDGNEIVLYWTPDEYYSNKNIPQNTILNFWERVLERTNKKKVTADIQVAYTDLNGEEIEFNSAEDFYIEYVDTYVGLNKYIILAGGVLVFFILFFIILGYKRKKKCTHCNKKINKNLAICPYCGKKQKKIKEKISDIKDNISEKIRLKKALKELKKLEKENKKSTSKKKVQKKSDTKKSTKKIDKKKK